MQLLPTLRIVLVLACTTKEQALMEDASHVCMHVGMDCASKV